MILGDEKHVIMELQMEHFEMLVVLLVNQEHVQMDEFHEFKQQL